MAIKQYQAIHRDKTAFKAVPPAVAALALAGLLAALPAPAHGCAGSVDSEKMNQGEPAVVVGADGLPLVLDAADPLLAELKVPGGRGFGFAIEEAGRAVPYRRATGGQPIGDIGRLRDLGFRAVVDLGTPPEVARRHKAETTAAGMGYFTIPFSAGLPDAEQARRFSRLIGDAGHRPLLVFAMSPDLLGAAWTVHRLYTGAARDAAFAEGRALGLTSEGDLKWHLKKGALKDLGRKN